MQAACPTRLAWPPFAARAIAHDEASDQGPACWRELPHAPSQRKLESKHPLAHSESWVPAFAGKGIGGTARSSLAPPYAIPLPSPRGGRGGGGRCPDFPFRRIGPRKSMRGDQKVRPQRPEHTGDSGFISPTYPRVTQLCYSSATVAEMGLEAGWQSGVRTSGFQDISPRVTWRAWWSPARRAPIESRRDRGNR